jgi:hypothetical protein
MTLNIIYTKNEWHLGDNMFCCIFFHNIKTYLEQNHIFIYHYCLFENIYQLQEFNSSPNIKILPLTDIPNDKKIHNLWMGCRDYPYNYYTMTDKADIFLCKFFNVILKNMCIPTELPQFTYDDPDLLLRCENINIKTDNKYNDIDILFINSQPLSGQFHYNNDEWNQVITLFSKKYNIVTTRKVEGIKCTLDDNLTIKDIAAISTKIKKIIAINTGPVVGLLNKYTLENVDNFYYFDNSKFEYSFPKFEKLQHIKQILSFL